VRFALNLATPSYSPAHYAKGTRSGGSGCPEIALPPLVGATVSGSLSLPSPGFFSPFPHGTGSLSVAREYLALEGGPPSFPRGCSGPVVLGIADQGVDTHSSTGLSPSLAAASTALRLAPRLLTPRATPHPRPTTPSELPRPVWAPPRSLAATWGISVGFFSSRY
jgi:hypothetical protein